MTAQVDNWVNLVIETLRAPAQAAEFIVSLRLERATVLLGLLAVAAANAFFAGSSLYIFPPDGPLPVWFASPMAVFALIAASVFISSHVLFWVGRAMGGTGSLTDIMALWVWLQALRALAQGVVLVLTFLSPQIAALFVLAIAIYGVYLLVHFLKVGMNFETIGQAVGLLLSVVVALVLGLMFLITLSGGAGLVEGL